MFIIEYLKFKLGKFLVVPNVSEYFETPMPGFSYAGFLHKQTCFILKYYLLPILHIQPISA